MIPSFFYFPFSKIREQDLIKDLALYFRNSIINQKYQPKIDLQDYLKHSPLLKVALPEIDHLKLRLNEYRNYDSHREFLPNKIKKKAP